MRCRLLLVPLFSAALALPAGALAVGPLGFHPGTLLPVDGAAVPRNALALVWGDADADLASLSATLEVSGETRTLTLVPREAMFNVVYELELGDLPAGETVTLTLTDPMQQQIVTYTVLDAIDQEPPVFRDEPFDDVFFEGQRTPTGEVSYDLSFSGPAADDDQLVAMYEIVHLVEAGLEEVVDRAPGGERERIGTELIWTGPEETRCYTAAAIDVGGNRTVLDDELCVDLFANASGVTGVPFGCRCTGAPERPALVGLLLIIALSRSFRRRGVNPTSLG